MKWLAVTLAALVALQPGAIAAQSGAIMGPDTRIYLTDGTVVEGHLVERSDDLIILRVDEEIFTFEPHEVDNIVTVDSLGGAAETVTVTEFPYISFAGGAVAFSLLSWLQFDRATDKENEADLNLEAGQLSRALDLQDEADRARLYGWSSAALAAATLGVALIPRRTTRRVFPAVTLEAGEPTLRVALVHRF